MIDFKQFSKQGRNIFFEILWTTYLCKKFNSDPLGVATSDNQQFKCKNSFGTSRKNILNLKFLSPSGTFHVCTTKFLIKALKISSIIESSYAFYAIQVCILLANAVSNQTVCSYHVMYAFQSEPTLYSQFGQFASMVECSFSN